MRAFGRSAFGVSNKVRHVPQGRAESSPAIYCWVGFEKNVRPAGDDRYASWSLETFAKI
jgi:hypothetical protein